MQNQFNSEYISNEITGIAPATVTGPGVKATTTQIAEATSQALGETELKTYGFEPRYGLGKPRRIVIRGKIAIE